MPNIKTVRVKNPAIEGDFMVINEADFQAGVHEPFEEVTEAPSLDAMTKDELVALAAERGLTVVRQDGKESAPTKDDYVAALSAPAEPAQ